MRLFAATFDGGRIIAWAITWACLVAVLESLAMSPERWASPELLLWWLTYWTLPLWCLIGALLLWFANRSERTGGLLGLGVGVLLVWPLAAFVQPVVSAAMNGGARSLPGLRHFSKELATIPNPQNWLSIGLYNTWIYFFYGGLLVAVALLTMRAERVRSMLLASAKARSRTQGLLDAERLRVLQAQVDPGLLLEAMREIEQRYRRDPQHAEKLLEALVEFLRSAMHGLRVPISTLDAEIRLARTFSNLQRERGIPSAWRLDADASIENAGIRFPSLLMLRLLALGGEGGRPLLRVRTEPTHTVLSLHGLTCDIPPELRQHINASLGALHGDGFELDCLPEPPTQILIRLHRPLA
ncbi:MAG TPA: histidine kinase [Steroidobacteraceae bacterium]